MSNGYASAPQQKAGPQVPTITLAEYEAEVKRILATEQANIDALKKEVEDLRAVIASKRARIASLDQELADEMLKRRASADALVAQAQSRLNDTDSANKAAHELYEHALKDAADAKADRKAAAELRASLETEQAVVRAKLRDIDALNEKLKEKLLKQDSILFECEQREAEWRVRANQQDEREAKLAGIAAGLEARKQMLDVHEATSNELRASLEAERKAHADATELLRVTQEARDEFNAAKAAVEAKAAGFAETEATLLARENRLKLDAKALQEGMAELERRRKNIEQLEAAAAKKL